MKILIVSKFFYSRGGAEVVAIGTRRMLLERGHEVRVFAMDHPENIALEEASYFPPQVRFDGGIADKLAGARRVLGRGNVVKAARRLLDDFRPDVVHLHNVHSYLSPVIGELAHQRGIRVVWTLHDYKLACPAYAFRRPDGVLCQECLKDPGALMRHRCMKGSMAASLMAKMEAKTWSKERISKFTDCFITPSAFMGEKMKEAGFPAEKITTVCNFVDPPKMAVLESLPIKEKGDGYFCFIGRLSPEKGIGTLIKGVLKSGVRLKLAGDGPLYEPLKKLYADNPKIEFLGKLDAQEVAQLLNHADGLILSSEWFENNPLSIIESLCAGTPVIGAEIGGIPELITEQNGRLYPSRDVDALAEVLRHFHDRPFNRWSIAANARKDFCEDTHLNKLLKIYEGKQ